MIHAVFTLGLSSLALFTTFAPNDWPWFQGPHRTGQIEVEGLEFDWSEGAPALAWRVATGPGYGGAAVHGDEVFLLDREVGSKDILRVFDLATGAEKWSTAYDAPGRLNFSGSRTVPSVDEKRVYTSGGFGHLTCFDRASHEILWQIDMQDLYGGEPPRFGWSGSPLLVGDLVIGTVLGEDVGLLAVQRESGEEEWVTEPVGHSHSTPVLMELLGKDQILFISNAEAATGEEEAAQARISSFNPTDGALNWNTDTLLTRLPIPAPVKVDDSHVFLTGGYRGGSSLLQLARSGDDYDTKILFHIERGAQVHIPMLHDGHLYLLANENWNDSRARRKEGGLMCLDLKGKELWRTKDAPYFGRGNMIQINDHLVIQDGYDGVLRVAKSTPKGYEQVAEADFFQVENEREDGQMWAPMAFARGKLLLRSQDELLCVRLQ